MLIGMLLAGNLFATSAALDAERKLDRVWVTTDQSVVIGCIDLGGVSNTAGDLRLLRENTLQRRGDVILLTAVDRGKHIAIGHAYRCGPATAEFPLPVRLSTEEGAAASVNEVIFTASEPAVEGCKRIGGSVSLVGMVDGIDLEPPLRQRAYNAEANVILVQESGQAKSAVIYRCPASAFSAVKEHARSWSELK